MPTLRRFPKIVLLTSLVAVGTGLVYVFRKGGDGPPAEVTRWVRQTAIPLRTTSPTGPLDDLRPWKETLAGFRLVGLGEATHGTREFFQLKHRLVRYLVEEVGATVFIIEGSYAAALRIDEYVRTGKGDRTRLLAGMRFWTWDTEEVLALVDWMRTYNAKVPPARQVRFLGNDMQVGFRSVPRRLRAFYRKVAPKKEAEAVATAERIVAFSDPRGKTDFRRIGQDLLPLVPGLAAPIDVLRKDLATNRTAYAKRSSAEEVEVADMLLRTMGQFLLVRSAKLAQSSDLRDRFMAENALRILEVAGPESKGAVWAHNLHVARNPTMKRMGFHLGQALGDRYYSLGFSFHEGAFQAVDMTDGSPTRRTVVPFTLPPNSNHLSGALAGADVGDLLVDFRRAPRTGPIGNWLASPQTELNIGATFNSAEFDPGRQAPSPSIINLVPRVMYDGIAFVRRTTAARPNPTGRRTPKGQATPRKG
ncbi:MAG: erythromycin esterase family protein [Fimbriimonas sp.]